MSNLIFFSLVSMPFSKKIKIILGYTFILFLSGTHAIRGGREVTDPSKYAFLVSLRDIKGHFCAGSIITRRFIISAAHCFIKYGKNKQLAKERLKIYAGTLSRISNHDAKVYTMDDYYDWGDEYFNHLHNDILLIKTAQNIAIDEVRIKKAILPTRDDLQEGMMVTAAGWGQYRLSGAAPRQLQEIELRVGGDERCTEKNRNYNHEEHFCTMDHPRLGTVYGDSGGPVIDSSGNLVGVISYRSAYDNDLTKYEVHVKVHAFRHWIAFWATE